MTRRAVVLLLLPLLLLVAGAARAAGDAACSVATDERLGCFGWWKWDTPARCGERGCCVDEDRNYTGKWCFFSSARAPITTVHVVQGCHLDVGFANTSRAIVDEWFTHHLPLAARVGSALAQKNASGPQLHFTAPAWIVSLFLQCPAELPLACPSPADRALVLDAIQKGWITWHAFPFNVQMELMDPSLVEFGVALVHQLDDLTGQRRKTVMSQRDVPGLTRAAIPILRRSGVRALSVGVNGGSTPPNVPKVFVWSDAQSDTSLRTMYLQGGYGGISLVPGLFDYTTAPGFSEAMIVAWRGDNAGPPPTAEAVEEQFAQIQREFPGAVVKASTFEDFVDALEAVPDSALPAVSAEIGDSWIHGVASDPLKVRATQRARTACLESGACNLTDQRFWNFSRLFLKNAEHTWGLDCKSTLSPPLTVLRANWSNSEFDQLVSSPKYVKLADSWREQRQWGLDAAVRALGSHPLAAQLQALFRTLQPYTPSLAGFTPIDPRKATEFVCGNTVLALNSSDGSLLGLYDLPTNTSLLGPGGMLLGLEYQTYSHEQYADFMLNYNYMGPLYEFDDWDDFDKVGIGSYGAKQRARTPTLATVWARNDTQAGETLLWLQLVFDAEVVALAGAPQAAWVLLRVPWAGGGMNVTVQLVNKTATRLPEAVFLRFAPRATGGCAWNMTKLGGAVDPTQVVTGGGKWMHVVDAVHYACSDQHQQQQHQQQQPRLTITPQDSGLVRWAPLSALPVPTTQGPSSGDGGAFVLYNNLWGTNYIMWYPFESDERSLKYEYTVAW